MFSFGFSKDSFRLSSTYEVLPSATETIFMIICIFADILFEGFANCVVCVYGQQQPGDVLLSFVFNASTAASSHPLQTHRNISTRVEIQNVKKEIPIRTRRSTERNHVKETIFSKKTLTIDTQAKGFSFGNGGLMLVSGGATSVEIIRSRHLTLYYSPSLESSMSWVDKSFQISLCKIQIGRSLELHLDGKRWKFSNDPKNQNYLS